jgi:hypothetical protein
MCAESTKLSAESAESWQAVIRELIKHENDLVHQRLGWLLQVQGLLFTALAFAWEHAPKPLPVLIALLGITTALSLWTAIRQYSPAVRGLRQWWQDHRPADAVEGPDVIGRWSPSSGIIWLLRPWRALPFVFVFAWVGVLVVFALATPSCRPAP